MLVGVAIIESMPPPITLRSRLAPALSRVAGWLCSPLSPDLASPIRQSSATCIAPRARGGASKMVSPSAWHRAWGDSTPAMRGGLTLISTWREFAGEFVSTAHKQPRGAWREQDSVLAMETESCGPAQRKILLVTDIGSDIDDIWCFLVLAHLQAEGRVQVVGIVTTGGNVRTRAKLARRWAKALSLVGDALVVPGCGDDRPGIHVAGFFEDEHPAAGEGGGDGGGVEDSSDFIFNVLREHGPNQVTVVAIGALTPLAAALERANEEAQKLPPCDGPSKLQLLQSLQCMAIQGQAVHGTETQLVPDVLNAFNLRDDAAAAHQVFRQLSQHVPFVLVGKHAAYMAPIWQRDLARLDAACPAARLPRLVRTMLLSFFCESRSKFAAVYPHAASLLAGEGPTSDEGDSWFQLVDPCCYTYDPLVVVFLVLPHLFDAQSHPSGRHVFVGNDAEHHGIRSPDAVHEELLRMMLSSLRRALFPPPFPTNTVSRSTEMIPRL